MAELSTATAKTCNINHGTIWLNLAIVAIEDSRPKTHTRSKKNTTALPVLQTLNSSVIPNSTIFNLTSYHLIWVQVAHLTAA
ncbi:hypothetical protein K4039_15640 [Lyngbya sp. CCAP 1446/10]|uniref:hypothetical protein n=1 Tax=Microcoleaceae TaxID=1892252 RepID=UPI002238FC9B|nr:hypothetical protein [Lyngbya sp. CCAP 1446/10]MCW6051481.1 hypothetical protein [Lyngbya sp. CCAP 1446/10]